MKRKEKITDIAVLSLLSVISIISIYRHLVFGYALTWSTYIGMALLFSGFIYKIVSGWKGRFLVFILLFLAMFGVINFTVEIIAIGYVGIGTIGLNPLIFLLLVIYSVICIDTVSALFRNINRGSEKEISGEREKMELFYYNKFIKLNQVEFQNIFRYYNDYPEEAKFAINKIKEEREK